MREGETVIACIESCLLPENGMRNRGMRNVMPNVF